MPKTTKASKTASAVKPLPTRTQAKKTPAAAPQEPIQPIAEESGQHVPGQVEETAPQPQEIPTEIPADGNNIAEARDRAFADTLPANYQKPVDKTFVGKD